MINRDYNICWLVVEPYTPLKKIRVKVNWDDDIPNWMEKEKMFETTNQLATVLVMDHEFWM